MKDHNSKNEEKILDLAHLFLSFCKLHNTLALTIG